MLRLGTDVRLLRTPLVAVSLVALLCSCAPLITPRAVHPEVVETDGGGQSAANTAPPATVSPPPATAPMATGVASRTKVPVAARTSKSAAPSRTPARPAPALGKSTPVRLRIPSIAVDSSLMPLGLLRDGSLQVPPKGFPAGWYTGAPTPGEIGPAIIAGHVDWSGRPGVFYRLRQLKKGATISTTRRDGTTATFRVTSVRQVPKNAFPTNLVYGNIDHAGLRLITCGGSFDRKARSYRDNTIVFAELVGAPR